MQTENIQLSLSKRERALRVQKLPLLRIPPCSNLPTAIASAPLPSKTSNGGESLTFHATALPLSRNPDKGYETTGWTFEKAWIDRQIPASDSQISPCTVS